MDHSEVTKQIVPIRKFKRIFDLMFIIVMSVVFVPIFVLISLSYLISMIFYSEDQGPLFYYEWRYSRGKKFKIIKFRTIKQSVLKKLIQKDQKNTFVKKLESDKSNLTKLGYILKQLYFDELPQFWCIVRGEMSLVGPRPWAVPQVEQAMSKNQYNKYICWPGLLGLVQVQKGDIIKTDQNIENTNCILRDNQYLSVYRNSSWWHLLKLDIRIIAKAIIIVYEAKGL